MLLTDEPHRLICLSGLLLHRLCKPIRQQQIFPFIGIIKLKMEFFLDFFQTVDQSIFVHIQFFGSDNPVSFVAQVNLQQFIEIGAFLAVVPFQLFQNRMERMFPECLTGIPGGEN